MKVVPGLAPGRSVPALASVPVPPAPRRSVPVPWMTAPGALTKLPLVCSTAPVAVPMTPLCVRGPARASVPPSTISVPVLTSEPRLTVCVDEPDFVSVPSLRSVLAVDCEIGVGLLPLRAMLPPGALIRVPPVPPVPSTMPSSPGRLSVPALTQRRAPATLSVPAPEMSSVVVPSVRSVPLPPSVDAPEPDTARLPVTVMSPVPPSDDSAMFRALTVADGALRFSVLDTSVAPALRSMPRPALTFSVVLARLSTGSVAVAPALSCSEPPPSVSALKLRLPAVATALLPPVTTRSGSVSAPRPPTTSVPPVTVSGGRMLALATSDKLRSPLLTRSLPSPVGTALPTMLRTPPVRARVAPPAMLAVPVCTPPRSSSVPPSTTRLPLWLKVSKSRRWVAVPDLVSVPWLLKTEPEVPAARARFSLPSSVMLPEGAFVKLPAEPLPISTRLLPRTCSEPSFTQGRLPATVSCPPAAAISTTVAPCVRSVPLPVTALATVPTTEKPPLTVTSDEPPKVEPDRFSVEKPTGGPLSASVLADDRLAVAGSTSPVTARTSSVLPDRFRLGSSTVLVDCSVVMPPVRLRSVTAMAAASKLALPPPLVRRESVSAPDLRPTSVPLLSVIGRVPSRLEPKSSSVTLPPLTRSVPAPLGSAEPEKLRLPEAKSSTAPALTAVAPVPLPPCSLSVPARMLSEPSCVKLLTASDCVAVPVFWMLPLLTKLLADASLKAEVAPPLSTMVAPLALTKRPLPSTPSWMPSSPPMTRVPLFVQVRPPATCRLVTAPGMSSVVVPLVTKLPLPPMSEDALPVMSSAPLTVTSVAPLMVPLFSRSEPKVTEGVVSSSVVPLTLTVEGSDTPVPARTRRAVDDRLRLGRLTAVAASTLTWPPVKASASIEIAASPNRLSVPPVTLSGGGE